MIDVPDRLLLGSGPSPVPHDVLAALALPTIGHMDPAFGAIVDEVADDLRRTFRTDARVCLPVSGTGSAGMELMVANLVRPGDRVLCGVHGVFGMRMADELERHGAAVERVEAEWGRAIPAERFAAAAERPFTALFVVHGETSTGVAQPLDDLRSICDEHGALLLVDCVTSLGGHPLDCAAAGVDAAFSGTQKCLNVPPGLAPFFAGERAVARVPERGPSWYFDLAQMLPYYQPGTGAPRAYHHTGPINLVYALAAGLRRVRAEGLDARWARHRVAHEALRAALAVYGLERIAPDGEQLHPLLAVRLPDGVDDAAVRVPLLTEDGIEISGGLGNFAGRAWRIGVMGEGARPEPQRRLVEALGTRLRGDVAGAVAALEAAWAAG